MEFATLVAILTFCAGAAFTLIDIGSDGLLAYEYWNNSYVVRDYVRAEHATNGLYSTHNSLFAILTTFWIGLGGIAQAVVVVYFFVRHDDRLNVLPKSIRIILLLSTPILMGPVVVNLYGASFVFRNANDAQLQENIQRYEYSENVLQRAHLYLRLFWQVTKTVGPLRSIL